MDTDRALMRRIRERDDQAFGELVRRHGGRMLAVAARVLGSRADAEDAVQRAFLSCLTAAGSYRPEWAVSTWLYRILSNICVDEIRRSGVRRSFNGVSPAYPGAGGRGAASWPASAARVRRADPDGERIDVQRALGKVPNEARILLVMHYVDGLSYGELAQVRGISVNTVKSQLARGKRILKAALEGGRA